MVNRKKGGESAQGSTPGSKKQRRMAAVALAGLFVLIMAIILLMGLWGKGKEVVETTEEIASGPATSEPETTMIQIMQTEETEPETVGYVSPIDFEGLWAVNPDVVGWLSVPGTNIDYPILHTVDNETYLHRSLEGEETVAGSIFLDCDDEGDFSSLHNVIYGHHMKDGSMFKDVVKFKEQEYFDQHRDIIIYTPDREIHLRTLAALYVKSEPIRRKTSFQSQEGFDAYVEEMIRGAGALAPPEGEISRLYSLITCSYEFSDARTILYAYERKDGNVDEEEEISTAAHKEADS